MGLAETLSVLSKRIRSRSIVSKAEVRQGVVLPLLHELDWPVFDTNVVRPSYLVNGDSVDFGLHTEDGRLVAIIIVDTPSGLQVEPVDPTLYLSDSDAPVVINTSGRVWQFMLSLQPKEINCANTLSISTDGDLSVQRFDTLLRYSNLISGRSKEVLASILTRTPVAREAIMESWYWLISQADSELLAVLSRKVEERFGTRPSSEELTAFLRVQDKTPKKSHILDESVTDANPPTPNLTIKLFVDLIIQSRRQGSLTVGDVRKNLRESIQSSEAIDDVILNLRRLDIEIIEGDELAAIDSRGEKDRNNREESSAAKSTGCWYRIGPTHKSVKDGKAVVLGILRTLEAELPGFLSKCAAHPENSGSSRRYIATTPGELYPKRPDYADDPGKYSEIVPGWLLMTNFNTDVKVKILNLAATIARLHVGRDITYCLDR